MPSVITLKNAATQRLKRSGKWRDFKDAKDKAVAEGAQVSVAWDRTLIDFGQEPIYCRVEQQKIVPEPQKRREGAVLVPARVAAKLEAKPDCSERDVVQWVFNNKSIDSLRPEDAPSTGAWGMLMDLRSGKLSHESFYSIWSKMLPNKTEINERTKKVDDGLVHQEFLDTIIKSLPEEKKTE